MTSRTPPDPVAGRAPAVRRAALPGGSVISPPSGVTDGKTPGPETGGHPSDRGQSPVRVRAKTPAGASDLIVSPPAGSTAIAAAMSEDRGPDSLDAHIRKLCADLGLLRFHVHDARRSPAGFPDLVIVGRGVLYRELKRQDGKVSPAQREWLDALAEAGADACVWRPSHLLNGAIARELTRISSLGGTA